jgi:hypothetical protein
MSLGLHKLKAPRVSRISALVCGKVVNPRHRPRFPYETFVVLFSVSGGVNYRVTDKAVLIRA